jgi:hypothetical protein
MVEQSDFAANVMAYVPWLKRPPVKLVLNREKFEPP